MVKYLPANYLVCVYYYGARNSSYFYYFLLLFLEHLLVREGSFITGLQRLE